MRSVADLPGMGERTITLDCDVLQADGGTRTAAITGAYVALHQAIAWLLSQGKLEASPLLDRVAAVSCGIHQGRAVLDLDYAEDSSAQADANFVFTAAGKIVEIQGTAEETAFSESQFRQLMKLAKTGVAELVDLQRQALGLK